MKEEQRTYTEPIYLLKHFSKKELPPKKDKYYEARLREEQRGKDLDIVNRLNKSSCVYIRNIEVPFGMTEYTSKGVVEEVWKAFLKGKELDITTYNDLASETQLQIVIDSEDRIPSDFEVCAVSRSKFEQFLNGEIYTRMKIPKKKIDVRKDFSQEGIKFTYKNGQWTGLKNGIKLNVRDFVMFRDSDTYNAEVRAII